MQLYAFSFRNRLKVNLQYPITSYELIEGHNTVKLQEAGQTETDFVKNKMHKFFVVGRPGLNHFFENYAKKIVA